MPFHFYKPARAWAVEKCVVLEWALSTAVADRTVQRVIDKQEFKNTFAVFLDRIGLSVNDQSFAYRQSTGGGWLRKHSNRSVGLLCTS